MAIFLFIVERLQVAGLSMPDKTGRVADDVALVSSESCRLHVLGLKDSSR